MIIDEQTPSGKNWEKYQHGLNIQNPDADDPPPYEEVVGASAFIAPAPSSSSSQLQDTRPAANPQSPPSQSARTATPPVAAPVPLFRPPHEKTVNFLSLYSRSDAIVGTYLVDPRLKHPLSQNRQNRSVERAHARNVRDVFGSVPGEEDGNESDESDRRGWLRRRSLRRPEVNAAFRTRQGNIRVILSIVELDAAPQASQASQQGERKVRGRVMLSSRQGRIEAKLTNIHLNRCVDLDVSTRDGNITVFLPPSYDGVVAFRTRRGQSGITFLPAFAAHAGIIRGSDHDILVSLSPRTAHTEVSVPQEGEDYCIIGTRDGKITVGLHGQDEEESAASQSSGLADLVGVLVGTGAKQLGSIMQTGTNAGMRALDATMQATASARESALQAREYAVGNGNRARWSALQARDYAMDSANRARASAIQGTRQARGILQGKSLTFGKT
ncbi:hypothetical protein DAEQUDRAFT_729187 [Daedalea quercina L-15889]|uniref:DUF7330 domain-containing protein n=1 Tax=Daedalea quercina L-15889 TaxID=1314783 RepID=A0A165NSZ9_9APHY|nr:hypothetical protein DAEQUDRAFT_729187 [Daedalea quercina L-15889]